MNTDMILNVEEEDDDIDLLELLFVLKSNIFSILTCTVIGAIVAFLVTIYLIKPVYSSSSMIYIFSKTTSVTSAVDLQLGKQLTIDFEILGKSRPVLEKVIEDLQLDTDYETLLKSVSVTNPTDSRIIKVTVSNNDPQLACDIANSMADNLAARVAEVIDTNKPSSVEDAVPAKKPNNVNKTKNTAMGGFLGLLIAVAIIMIKYFSDMSIRTEDDVRKRLGLSTLATIPYEKSISKEHKSKKDSKFKIGKKKKA